MSSKNTQIGTDLWQTQRGRGEKSAHAPPTTGNGRYATASAKRNFPARIRTAPREAVDNPRRTTVVDTISATRRSSTLCLPPASLIIFVAMPWLMADRNIRPFIVKWWGCDPSATRERERERERERAEMSVTENEYLYLMGA